MTLFLTSIKEKMMTAQQFSGASSGKQKSRSLFRRNSKYRTELTPFEDAPSDAPWKIGMFLCQLFLLFVGEGAMRQFYNFERNVFPLI